MVLLLAVRPTREAIWIFWSSSRICPPPTEYAGHDFDLLHEIQDAVGSEVDLLTPRSVTRPSLEKNIREQGVTVYEA